MKRNGICNLAGKTSEEINREDIMPTGKKAAIDTDRLCIC